MIKNCPTLKNLVPLFFLLCSFSAFSQTFIDNTPNGTETITVPANVTQVTIEVWGAGGGGGTSWENKYSAGGAGGGAYTLAVIDGLTSGQIISYTVGSGGLGGWNTSGLPNPQSGIDGGATSATTFSPALSVKANGGKGGGGVPMYSTNAGNGGSGGVKETLPFVSYDGGAGRSGYSSMGPGGGGGSSAGIGNPGTGTPATSSTGAEAPLGSNGGNGGYGTSTVSPSIHGSIPGGGGGGSVDSNGAGTGYRGGNGGNGQIRITWSTLDFIGTINNDYVDFGNTHDLTTSFSLEAWVLQKATTAGVHTIISKGTYALATSQRGYYLAINGSNQPTLRWSNTLGSVPTLEITSSYGIANDKWYHIAATYDGTTAKIYIDGVLVVSGLTTTPPTSGTEKFLLGAMYDSGTPTIPKNNFDGYIDEVRVWEVALTAAQIREMMNQEIQLNAVTGKVRGKKIPIDISGEVLCWTNLKGYYPMNDNTTNDKSNNASKHGSTKNMTSFQPQTAPLPYTTIRDGSWSDITAATPWTFGNTVWNIPNNTGINGTTKVDWNIVETAHNITSGDKDITVLGLISTGGILKIANTTDPQDETNGGQSLHITHYLELDGAIDLVGESQLLQDTGSILDQDSGGYIERDQQGTANSYNYNYWSSSVGPINGNIGLRGTGVASTNSPFTINGIINDGRAGTHSSIVYGTSPYAADATLGETSPLTISSYWLYTFYGADDNYWAWKRVNINTPILAGEGYTMKGTSGAVAIATMQNYVFRGKPYNGDFKLHIDQGKDRLIGNPYPSAMDADEFIKDNIKETINSKAGRNLDGKNIFNGALYFWDHFGQVNSHNLGAYVGGYATYTLMGGSKAYSNDYRINHNGATRAIEKKPTQYIPVGQGFFVIAAIDGLSNSTTSVDGGDIVFKNSQRIFKTEGLGNSVFMKGVKSKNDITEIEINNDKRPKIWLQFDSPAGYHRQMLIGADENTTNHFDLGFDAFMADIGSEDMFWTFDGAKFVIQGVPNFDDNQEFLIGVKIAKAGLTTIKIDELENMEEDISVHIKDKLTGETHNISKKPFEIDLAPGTYLDRFALTFKTQKLVTEDVVAELLIPAAAQPIIEGIHVYMNNATGELQIKNNSTEEITNVALINAVGQTVKTWNSNFNVRTISLPISTATGVYNVQITTKKGTIVKKIMVE